MGPLLSLQVLEYTKSISPIATITFVHFWINEIKLPARKQPKSEQSFSCQNFYSKFLPPSSALALIACSGDVGLERKK